MSIPSKVGKKLIALDYDGTYTADPELWQVFIKRAQARGHDIVIATMRTLEERNEMCSVLRELVPWVVCTHRRAKLEYLAAFKIYPDIWIDDTPHFLFQNGAQELPEDPGTRLESLLKV